MRRATRAQEEAEKLQAEMLTGMNPMQLETVRTLLGAGGDPTRRRLHRHDAQQRTSSGNTTSTTRGNYQGAPRGRA
jgi:hypothetical protein